MLHQPETPETIQESQRGRHSRDLRSPSTLKELPPCIHARGEFCHQWMPTDRAVRVCVVASKEPCTFTIAPAVTSARLAVWFLPFM